MRGRWRIPETLDSTPFFPDARRPSSDALAIASGCIPMQAKDKQAFLPAYLFTPRDAVSMRVRREIFLIFSIPPSSSSHYSVFWLLNRCFSPQSRRPIFFFRHYALSRIMKEWDSSSLLPIFKLRVMQFWIPPQMLGVAVPPPQFAAKSQKFDGKTWRSVQKPLPSPSSNQ
jgi:hypothetical protein